MLPKFASHVLHQTQRAAQAAAQNHAFRNVFGLQNQGASSSSSGSLANWGNVASGSSWGSAGGAKYNSGSRFYQGYTGSGRVVTQANPSSSHDLSNGRTDEEEEFSVSRPHFVIKARRPRSSSTHLTGTGRQNRAETFGVLQTVHLHHTRTYLTSTKILPNHDENLGDATETKVSRKHIRRNSSSASIPIEVEVNSLDNLDPDNLPQRNSLESTPHSIYGDDRFPPYFSQHEENPGDGTTLGDASLHERLESARKAHDHNRVVSEVLRFRKLHKFPTVKDFNLALFALATTRQGGQPITLILETYNDMLQRQINPNVRTYKTMVAALCDRDREVERICFQIEWRQKRRAAMGLTDSSEDQLDSKQLRLLHAEDNFGSAMLVFEAAQALSRNKDKMNISLGQELYNCLLRSCMIHANTDAAVRVWSALESIPGSHPSANAYVHLLGTYVSANEIEAAEDVFNEFLLASKEQRIDWEISIDDTSSSILGDDIRSGKARTVQMLMWVKMIEGYFRSQQPVKAVNLLEKMMDSDAPLNFGPEDIPKPCSAVYSSFIRGFISNNNLQSALSWFDRLLREESTSWHPLIPSSRALRPDQTAWDDLMESLIQHGLVDEANKKFKQLSETAHRDGLMIRTYDRLNLFDLNVKCLHKLSRKDFEARVEFLSEYLFKTPVSGRAYIQDYRIGTFCDFIVLLGIRGYPNLAVGYLCQFLDRDEPVWNMDEIPGQTMDRQSQLLTTLERAISACISTSNLAFSEILALHQICKAAGALPPYELCAVTMDYYFQGLPSNEADESYKGHWKIFSGSAAYLFASKALSEDLFKEYIISLKDSGHSDPQMERLLVEAVCEVMGDRALEFIELSCPEWTRHLPPHDVTANQPQSSRPELQIDNSHSRLVDEYFPSNPQVSPQMAWERYENGLRQNVSPQPDVIGRLISTFGRMGDLKKVHKLYEDGQHVLSSLEHNKDLQSVGWYALEDQMIIALAHAGQLDKAHIHRQRIISQGGSPSADAYGALIQCVRETTDDSANALSLWQEAQSRAVVPNLYLYNTVISKLSRARKADYALELFQQMKANFVRPSSVTYGAVIAACCRVGDAHSAEVLFEEMVSQPNFKPRIPPYNTMIQFYTHIIRDRERALYYYEALISAGITPSAHTYKLLMDCYGTIEPIDQVSMDAVFANLISDPKVQVQGVHWAALINSWGCVQRNLERAMDIFDSIPRHHTTLRAKNALPDAIVYESMINVLVTLRRTDLIPSYLKRLSESGIHMTAYIANLLIKGYAIADDIQKSREIFERLYDPPVGHAAPNNHNPQNTGSSSLVDSPVYREPSTWEAMVRAELGSGNRDNAIALLKRAEERRFPPAVYARISGILLDGTVSPWSPTSLDSSLAS